MSITPVANGKKTIIGAKFSRGEKDRVLSRCNDLKCNATDYIKRLIDSDIEKAKKNTRSLRIAGEELIIRCDNCGDPVPFRLADLGLRRI